MKKAIVSVLAILLVFVFLTINCCATSRLYGDVNNDGVVSIIDASEIQFFIVNLHDMDSLTQRLGDVDADGFVSILDATLIQRYLVYLVDVFPAENFVPATENDGYYDIIVKP